MRQTLKTMFSLLLLMIGATTAMADDGVLATWDFTNSSCPAGQAAFQGNSGTVASDIEGVNLYVDATNGKFNSKDRSSDIQINATTIIQVPVKAKGDVITITNYPDPYGIGYTIGADEVAKSVGSYTYAASKIEATQGYVVMTVTTSGYALKISVLQHEPQQEGGKIKEADLINTDITDLSDVGSGDANNLQITTTGSKENITFTFHNTTCEPGYTNKDKFGDTTGAMVAQKNGQATITTSAFADITKVTYVHGATGSNRGWGLMVKGDGDSDWVTLSTAVANPAKGATVTVDVNRKNVQLQWYNLADAQNAMMFNLNIKGNITVYGEEYEVAAKANIAEAGSATIYPAGGTYTEGDEIQLTATENFGYDFENWTNAAGEVVSTDAKFKVEVTANETYTANFKKVNTYALNVTVEGGANDYQVTLTPAPTIVDGKNMYEEFTRVKVAAIENPIITFNSWSNGETLKEIDVDMVEDVNLTATFSAIDFIVGWDFYKAGNNGRAADFYAAENDAVSLVLRDEAGKNYGWLDKSAASGGYEGRPGGVNWIKDLPIGTTYWQTKVNAEAFTSLKIKTAMVYNYNAYQKYDVQASLDGTEWETIGSINMSGVKNWTDLEAAFPAKYDNKKEVYVRWIADKTSKIDGATSANDGACIGATYITGTAKLIDDGTAPVLVNTVPAEGADNASANGKIVLTFDEKVKVAEGAKATLGDMQIAPAVSGKTVAFEYKGLKYATAYTFSLPANSVADLTDNYMAEAVTINFQTKVKPTIEKGMYDAIVSNGEELAAAIKAANARADQNTRFRIFVKEGAHVLPTNGGTTTGGDGKTYDDPRTTMTASNVSIIGEDYNTTSFTNITPAATWDNGYGPACPLEGIGAGDVLINKGTGNYFQGVTIRTSMGDAHGRDIAFNDQGNKTIFKDARLWGYQDTYVSNSSKSRFYFENGVIRGRTDYICGKGDVWYEKVTFQQVKSGYLAVPSQPTKYGYILNECRVVSDGTGSNDANGAYTLGRPWGSGTPIALFINCTMEAVPTAEGWSEMSGGWPARFAEYNSVTKTGTVIDLSQRKKTFGNEEKGIHVDCNNPVLSAEEASEYSIAKVMGADDDWDPTAATEQASAPTNVNIIDTALSWDDSNYVLCWAICKNGKVVDFTIEPSYTVDDTTAEWSVRAANEMGGLGEATKAEVSTGIKDIMTGSHSAENARTEMYNLAGQRVNAAAKGIIIKAGKKFMNK